MRFSASQPPRSLAQTAERGWPARVSVVAVGRWRKYPESQGAKPSPLDYLRAAHGSEVVELDVTRCR